MPKKANHQCKHCRKEYYFCDNCGSAHHFMEVACSPECYIEYQNAVLAARQEGNKTHSKPITNEPIENKNETHEEVVLIDALPSPRNSKKNS